MTATATKPDPAELDGIILGKGNHDSREDGLCVMEAVAYFAGRPHSDAPPCVSPAIGAFLRSWNDTLPDDDRQQLKRWVLPVLNTATNAEDEARRAWLATDWLAREFAPAWLRLAQLDDHARALEALPELDCDERANEALAVIRAAESAARSVARSAAWSAAESAAWSAAWSVARSAAWSAAWSAARSAARSVAESAARSAAWSAAESAAWSAARSAAWSAAESVAESVARSAAESAARQALEPTVILLQGSAHRLLERMVAVGHAEPAEATA